MHWSNNILRERGTEPAGAEEESRNNFRSLPASLRPAGSPICLGVLGILSFATSAAQDALQVPSAGLLGDRAAAGWGTSCVFGDLLFRPFS